MFIDSLKMHPAPHSLKININKGKDGEYNNSEIVN